MSCPYFDGIKYDSVLHWNVFYRRYDYMLLVSQYLDKNRECIKRGIPLEVYNQGFLEVAVQIKLDLKWFKLLFDLCDKVNVGPRKDDFENALSNKNFDKISKECQLMIQQYYNKFYPKQTN